MCGIVGHIGKDSSTHVMRGLKTLESRGYDSSGIAALEGSNVTIVRRTGKFFNLEAALESEPVEGSPAIGHVRWACQGVVNETNAHPHRAGRVSVVHNGNIENSGKIKMRLEEKGRVFTTQTDTEVFAHLVDEYLNEGKDELAATQAAISELQGGFAFGMIFTGRKDFFLAAKNSMPLLIGFNFEGGAMIGSDPSCFASFAESFIELRDGDIAVIRETGATIYDANGREASRPLMPITVVEADNNKGDFPHHMLKEIFQQPEKLRDNYRRMAHPFSRQFQLSEEVSTILRKAKRLYISACGTSLNSSLAGKLFIEQTAQIPVNVQVASELHYNDPVLEEGTVGVVISQSGETADTCLAMEHFQSKGHPVIGILNVRGSKIARSAEGMLYTDTGKENSVASTKAFTAQMQQLAMLGMVMGRERGVLSRERETELMKGFEALPEQIDVVLRKKQFKQIGQMLRRTQKMFYLARGVLYPIALEGALKIKEIAYVSAEGYPAGEMKHGPNALVDDDLYAVVLAPSSMGVLFQKTLLNLEVVRARGGKIILVTDEEGCKQMSGQNDITVVCLPTVDPFFNPFLATAAVQLIAYETAVAKGLDVDQPRNLAKSVTVE